MVTTRGFRWYAVSALSGREEKAKRDLLANIAKAGLGDGCREITIPKETFVEHNLKGERKEKEKTIMPGYVFLLMDAKMLAGVVLTTPGVYGFVQGSDNPIPLSEEEVERFLGRGHAKHHVSDADMYQIGDAVRITTGPMTDFSGEIQEVNKNKQTVTVAVEIFGQSTPTEVAMTAIHKA
jgi:transcriptional antiterminator NusG